MTQRFTKAVDKLIRAFFNGTLEKGNCHYCAVGNICDGSNEWATLFHTCPHTLVQDTFGLNQYIYFENRYKKPLEVIEQTGYTPEQLAEVEYAFEVNTMIDEDMKTRDKKIQSQFNGLCAVFDKLCEFDNIPNSEFYKDKLREGLTV